MQPPNTHSSVLPPSGDSGALRRTQLSAAPYRWGSHITLSPAAQCCPLAVIQTHCAPHSSVLPPTGGAALQARPIGGDEAGVSRLPGVPNADLKGAPRDVGAVEFHVDGINAVLPRDETHGVFICGAQRWGGGGYGVRGGCAAPSPPPITHMEPSVLLHPPYGAIRTPKPQWAPVGMCGADVWGRGRTWRSAGRCVGLRAELWVSAHICGSECGSMGLRADRWVQMCGPGGGSMGLRVNLWV